MWFKMSFNGQNEIWTHFLLMLSRGHCLTFKCESTAIVSHFILLNQHSMTFDDISWVRVSNSSSHFVTFDCKSTAIASHFFLIIQHQMTFDDITCRWVQILPCDSMAIESHLFNIRWHFITLHGCGYHIPDGHWIPFYCQSTAI